VPLTLLVFGAITEMTRGRARRCWFRPSIPSRSWIKRTVAAVGRVELEDLGAGGPRPGEGIEDDVGFGRV
jgi:hypothetical protein